MLHHDSCPNKTLTSLLQPSNSPHETHPQGVSTDPEAHVRKINLNPKFLLHLVFPLPRSNLHLLDTRRVWLASNRQKNKSAHTKEFHLRHNTNIDFHIIQ